MIYLYYGSDTYSILQEIKSLKAKFKGQVEELELTPDLPDHALRSRLQELLESQGLFAREKLVILRNFLDGINKFPGVENYLTLTLSDIGEGKRGEVTIVFLQTENFDARRSFFKKLKAGANAKEFEIPQNHELAAWIKKYLAGRGFRIEKQALDKFIDRLGEAYSLWQAVNELEKLTLYVIARSDATKQSQGHEIAAPSVSRDEIKLLDVNQIVPRSLEQNVFVLTNFFSEGETVKATRLLENLLPGSNPAELKKQAIQLLGAIASQLRSLLLIKEVENLESEQAAKVLAWKTGRVWVMRRLSKKFSIERLTGLLRDLKQIDFRLKTSEEPPKLLLSLFLQKAKVTRN